MQDRDMDSKHEKAYFLTKSEEDWEVVLPTAKIHNDVTGNTKSESHSTDDPQSASLPNDSDTPTTTVDNGNADVQPTASNEQTAKSRSWAKLAAIGAGAVVVGAGAVVAAPFVLTAAGVTAGGTVAASLMSSAAVANGGGVAAAVLLQSVGAGVGAGAGLGVAATAGVAAGGGLVGAAAGAGVAEVIHQRKEAKRMNEQNHQVEAAREVVANEDEKLCVVCLDEIKCMAFDPCGHLCTCVECSEQLLLCPICRTDIADKKRIFF